MNEEEKEIIKEIDDLLEYMQEEFEDKHSCFNKREYKTVKGLLDLYYKQQKELEPIKKLNIPVETLVSEFNRLEDLEDNTEILKVN